jgi:glyoxylase-like metal-dependent hydrolase (beta-lactamase superfamily II)
MADIPMTEQGITSTQVDEGIHRIEIGLGERYVACYFLKGKRRSLLVDTGVAPSVDKELLPGLETAGIDSDQLDYVLISHADFDHQGGNARVREVAPRSIFMCHALDKSWIESVDLLVRERYDEFAAPDGIAVDEDTNKWYHTMVEPTAIDIALQGGEQIALGDLDVEVLHTPGHSWGHLSLYVPSSRTLIIEDAALGHGLLTAAGGEAFPPTYRYVASYTSSIERLRGMPVDTLLTGHYPVMSGADCEHFLAESRAYIERVQFQIDNAFEQVGPAGLTMKQLIEEVGSSLGSWTAPAQELLVYPLTGHLELMEQRGQVQAERGAALTHWHKTA